MAPRRGAEAERARPAHGLPRDHQGRDRASARRHRARSTTPRRRAGDAADPRPPLRLRGLAGALEEGDAGPLGGARAVGRDAARRRARARARSASSPPSTGTSRASSTRAERVHVRDLVARRREAGRDRAGTSAPTGTLATGDAVQLDEAAARGLAAGARAAPQFAVRSVERKPYTRRPTAPFMTSTLQQEASRKLRFSVAARRCASRSASTRTATSRTCAPTRRRSSSRRSRRARDQARELYGADSVPASAAPVRPEGQERAGGARGDPARRATASARPTRSQRELERDEHALYELVWKRTVASQMADARGETRLGAASARPPPTGATPSSATAGTVITFRGFLLAYEEGRDDAEPRPRTRRSALPPLGRGQELEGAKLEPDGHATTPPARYTEASARPGARGARHRPAVDLRVDHRDDPRPRLRVQEGQALVPSFLAFAVTNLLEQHFDRLVDYEFTARMEDDLDRIAVRHRGARPLAAPLLLRRRTGDERAERPRLAPRRDRRAGDQHDRDRRRRSSSGSAVTGRTSSARTSARRSPTTSRPTS